ncbi:MAG: hypothetical protein R3348_01215 [Xanthomonadales bacterium]|nr:hypothetical protein [Xanthomonadales bacterium]
MKCIRLILLAGAVLMHAHLCFAQEEQPGFVTRWVITPAAGMDAILLLGAAAGDIMQAEIYPDDIARVREAISAEGLAALERIDQVVRVQLGKLTGPTLAYLFSAGPLDSLDDVIASAADPIGRLKPALMTSPYWDAQEFAAAQELMPTIHTALVALRDAGFNDWYRRDLEARILESVAVNRAAVAGHDIIPEQERLLGRKLDPRIELLVVNYAKPYGIRILGQRFVAYYGWKGETQLHVATHELFHPPYDIADEGLAALLEPLRQDAWLANIVENHDPRYGYNSFEGLVNEACTQALDQLVAERLGFAHDPGKRWRHADGGMHMLAAAIYQAMKQSGFAERGGRFEDWFRQAMASGLLAPEAVRAHATVVVGQDAVDRWAPG